MGPLTINPYPLGDVRFQSYNFWLPEEEHFDWDLKSPLNAKLQLPSVAGVLTPGQLAWKGIMGQKMGLLLDNGNRKE